MPPTDGSHAAARVAAVLQALDKHQPPLALRPPVADMIEAIAPYAPLPLQGLCAYVQVWCACEPC
jgi:hypothetical protein